MPPAYLKGPKIAIRHTAFPVSCVGKVAFDIPAQAAEVTRRSGGHHHNDDAKPRCHYRCRFCGKWHVGTVGQPTPRGAFYLVRAE